MIVTQNLIPLFNPLEIRSRTRITADRLRLAASLFCCSGQGLAEAGADRQKYAVDPSAPEQDMIYTPWAYM